MAWASLICWTLPFSFVLTDLVFLPRIQLQELRIMVISGSSLETYIVKSKLNQKNILNVVYRFGLAWSSPWYHVLVSSKLHFS